MTTYGCTGCWIACALPGTPAARAARRAADRSRHPRRSEDPPRAVRGMIRSVSGRAGRIAVAALAGGAERKVREGNVDATTMHAHRPLTRIRAGRPQRCGCARTMSAEELRQRGNAAFADGRFAEATEAFMAAIALDPNNHVLYSNRSAAYASLGRYEEALRDADKAVTLNPSWPKGYSRKGAALAYLGRTKEAAEAYRQGLDRDPNNAQLKEALAALEAGAAATDETEAGSGAPFESLLNRPEVMARLAANPQMRALMSDPAFLAKLRMLKSNPTAYAGAPRMRSSSCAPASDPSAPPGRRAGHWATRKCRSFCRRSSAA